MARQPEIGSALGLTTAEVIARCDRRLTRLAGLRADLISGIGKTIDALNAGEPPDETAARLHHTLEGVLIRCRS